MTEYVKHNGEWEMPSKTFLKRYGEWGQVAGLRNVLSFNGISQYAEVPRVEEFNTALDNGIFEISWYGQVQKSKVVLLCAQSKDNNYYSRFGITADYANCMIPLGGTLHKIGIGSPEDYKEGYWRVVADGIMLNLYYNNTKIGDVALNIGPKRIDDDAFMRIGAGQNSFKNVPNWFYQGNLRDIKIWTGGDRNTGTLTRHYRMDTGWRGENNQVLVNSATELGEELVVNGDFSDGLTGWNAFAENPLPTVVDGVALGNTTARHFLYQGMNLNFNRLYEITTTAESVGATNVETRGGGYGFSAANNDTTYYVDSANRDNIIVKESGVSSLMAVDNVSVRQADGYGTYVGLTEASWTEEEV